VPAEGGTEAFGGLVAGTARLLVGPAVLGVEAGCDLTGPPIGGVEALRGSGAMAALR
jgi:hypothetical protein